MIGLVIAVAGGAVTGDTGKTILLVRPASAAFSACCAQSALVHRVPVGMAASVSPSGHALQVPIKISWGWSVSDA